MRNQRVVSALMIGISAMMALQAPITAYANDKDTAAGKKDNQPEITSNAEQEADSYENITDEAQKLADDAEESCVVEDVQAQPEENQVTEENGAGESGGAEEGSGAGESGGSEEGGGAGESGGAEEGSSAGEGGSGEESGGAGEDGSGEEAGGAGVNGGAGEDGSGEESGGAGEGGSGEESGGAGEDGSGEESGGAGEGGSGEESGGAGEGGSGEESGGAGEGGSGEEAGGAGVNGGAGENGSGEESGGAGESSSGEGSGGAVTNEERTIAEKEVAEVANLILSGDEEKNIASVDAQEKTPETDALKDAAEAIIIDKVDEVTGEVEEKSALTEYQEAAQHIANAKQDLGQAEEANKDAETAYQDTVNALSDAADVMEGDIGLIKTADKISETASNTNKAAQDYVDKISNAGSVEEAESAKDELIKLLNQKEADINSQKEWFGTLSQNYIKAMGELDKAQEALDEAETTFGNEISDATGKTKAARADVEAAEEKVKILAEALQKVQDSLPETGDAGADKLASLRGNNWEGRFGTSDFKNSREAMKEVILGYYLPGVLEIDVITDKSVPEPVFETVKHSGKYEKDYTKLTYYYKDDNGNTVKGVKYFNWDSIAKTDTAHQNLTAKDDPEASTAIVMYEKTLDEVVEDISTELISAHKDDEMYQRNDEFILSSKNLQRCSNQGMYRLYTYTDEDGKQQYITQFELYGGNPTKVTNYSGTYDDEGDLTRKFKSAVDDNGDIVYTNSTYYDSSQKKVVEKTFKNLKMVADYDKNAVQNKNGLYRDANCLILGDNQTVHDVLYGMGDYSSVHDNVVSKYGIGNETLDRLIEENRKLNDFITNNSTVGVSNLLNQYKSYSDEMEEAKKAANNAVEKVKKLENAISTIETKSSRANRALTAKEALGLNISVAEYLGLTGLSEEEIAEYDNLDIKGLREKLDELKGIAEKKVADANISLNEAKQQKDKASEAIVKLVEKLTAAQKTDNDIVEDEHPAVVEKTVIDESKGETIITPAAENVKGDVIVTLADETKDDSAVVTPANEVKEKNAVTSVDEAVPSESVQDVDPESLQGTTPIVTNKTGDPSTPKSPTTWIVNSIPETPDAPGNPNAFVATMTGGDGVTINDSTDSGYTVAFADAGEAVANGGAVTSDAAQGDGAVTAQAVGGAQAGGVGQVGGTTQTVQAGGGAQDVQAGGDAVEIADEDVALAGNIDETAPEVQDDASKQEKASVNIQDEDVALAEIIPEDVAQQRISWWWLLVIALLGATGKKMYDEHMKKKEEEENKIKD